MELTADDVTYIRLLITDTDDADPIFSEGEIDIVASHEKSLKRTAARLLETMAASEVLVAKKITTQDLQTDGPAVAAALRALAGQLRGEAEDDDADSFPALVVEPYRPNLCGDRPELTELAGPYWPDY